MPVTFDRFLGASDDMEMNAEACRLLNVLQRMDRAAKVQYLVNYFGGNVEVDVQAAATDPVQWPFAVCRRVDKSIWFVGGSPTPRIVSQIVDDYVTPSAMNFRYHVMQRAVDYGVQILGDPSYRKYEGQDIHRYFAWSYGAVIASYLIQRAPTAHPAPVQSIISYGSPRGVTDEYFKVKRGSHLRWWMSQDIVPAMPPHQDEAPGTNTLFWGFLRGHRANDKVHPQYGARLNDDGTVAWWQETSDYWQGRTFPLTPVEAWWSSNDLSHGHNLELYAAAFQRGVSMVLPSPPPVPTPPQPDTESTVRSRERPEIVRQAAAQIAAEIAQPRSLVRDYLFTGITPNERTPFRARVSEGTWFVLKGEQVVEVGPGKRTAKSLARRYNRAQKGR